MLNWLRDLFVPRGYRPYRASWSREQRPRIDRRCRKVAANLDALGLNNPFSLYRRATEAIRRNPRAVVRPLRRLMEPVPAGRFVVGLRHDCDDDILTALRAARHLARLGLPGSFYLLHVSHYYGHFSGGRFFRHPGMRDYLRALVVAGCEIGLHNDALGVYHRHGIDGLAAVRAEIAWLREEGVRVHGTAAHNSAPVYGAENFEIFRHRALGGRGQLAHGTRQIPLGRLDEKGLGLTYEANYPVVPREPDAAALASYLVPPPPDAIRSTPWLEAHFLHNPVFQHGYDVSIWLLGRDQWMIARHAEPKSLVWPASLDRVTAFLDECGDGIRVVFNIHPEYVSSDAP